MSQSASVFLRALGLKSQPSFLSSEPGSLIQASNVVFHRDNVIQSRRGFKLFGESFGSASDRAKQLFSYKQAILRYYDTTIDFDTGEVDSLNQEIFNPFAGTFNEVVPGLRPKSVEANGNLYITTSNGVQKISARTAADFSTEDGFILPAGGINAVDVSTRLSVTSGEESGFLPQDSTVAYRILWNYNDINGNLVQGAPSQRSEIFNPLLSLLINDTDVLLQALDNLGYQTGSIINATNNVQSLFLPANSNALAVLDNLTTLATNLDTEIGTLIPSSAIIDASINVDLCTISLNDDVGLYGRVAVGDQIFLNGFTPALGTLNGVQTVSGVNAITGTEQSAPFTFINESGGNYTGLYFTLWNAGNQNQYYIWFQTGGVGTDPAVAGATGVPVNITSGSTGATIATDVASALASLSASFTTSVTSNILTVTTTKIGQTNAATTGTLAGVVSIGTVTLGTASSITFNIQNATASGNVTTLDPTIQSGWFRSFTPAAAPINIIATDQELVNIQTYLSQLTTELQSDRNLNEVANNSGIPAILPLDISSAVVSGGTTLTINFNTSITGTDAGNQFVVGDKLDLLGTWTSAGSQDLSGIQTVATTATGHITVTLGSSVTNGSVTLNSASSVNRIVRFTNTAQNTYLLPLALTTSANVFVDITFPPGITTNDFFQIYRSQVNQATGTTDLSDLVASDEMALVYEQFATQAEIDAGSATILDIVFDSFRGANLYTNPNSGQGLLQANDVPPLCQDINIYKGFTFFANTQTEQQLNISLLGVQTFISEFNAGRTPQLTIASVDGGMNTYSFIPGVNQVDTITFLQAETGSNYTSKYFTINAADNTTNYYVWYTVGSVGTDPAPSGLTAIPVLIQSSDTADVIAEKTLNSISLVLSDFVVSGSGASITVTNTNPGLATAPTIGTFSSSTISAAATTPGVGQLVTQEETSVTCIVPTSLAGKYFTLNTPYNLIQNYVWYQVNGIGTDPAPAGRTGILVSVLSTDTAINVATKTAVALNATTTYTATNNGTDVITITNVNFGPTAAATAATSGFTVVETVIGALNVLLSTVVSPAEAVTNTAVSLVNVINLNRTEIISAYYESGDGGIPGQMLFVARDFSVPMFYLLMDGNTSAPVSVGASWNPSLAPTNLITANTAASPSVITSTAHGLVNGDQIVIAGSNSTPSINGIWTVTVLSANTFSIPINVTVAGTTGGWTNIEDGNNAVFSSNQTKLNRLYYSKFQQPESVPILNSVDIGSQDQAIIRIMPLRDSLMIFKQDGLYRLSGQTTPWTIDLFDSSCIVLAPDSVSIMTNTIYAWTNQGIMTITEAGTQKVDRDIDDDIAAKSTSSYTNFSTATWGLGYNSDKTYLVWTVSSPTDTEATIAYIYNSQTNCWTTYDKTNTCGIVNTADNRLYLGAGDVNFIEQERKNFNRQDYADRETTSALVDGSYLQGGTVLSLPTVAGFKFGDVVTQDQFLTIYDYNVLLQKLDLDPGLQNRNYTATLTLGGGADLRNALIGSSGLAAALNSDPGADSEDYLTPILTKSGPLASNSEATATVFTMPTANFIPSNVNTSTSVITITGSDYTDGQQVQFTTSGTLPGGLALNTNYWIVNSTTNTFQVSLSLGGAAVTLTSQGTGTHTINLCHGLVNNREVSISGVVGSIPDVNGDAIVTVIDNFNFSIPVTVTTGGTGGLFETEDETFQDIRACYNNIINMLNLDPGVAFRNYNINVNTTTQEAIIFDVNPILHQVTLNIILPYVTGPLTILESIVSTVTYTPLTMGDPVGYKQINTCHALFENQAFTQATIGFSTDLLPDFSEITFNGFGNGTFGNQAFGTNFFGGGGNSQPFRTYIPRNAQRCTFMNVQFTHQIANEMYALYGIGLSGNVNVSDRAYR
jgi:hypothetical protein